MNLRRIKILGAYLLVISILQFCLYFAMFISSKTEWLFYFDPRIGFLWWTAIATRVESTVPSFFSWLSAVLIFILGIFLLLGRPLVKTYIICEIVLLIPNITYILFIIWTTHSPNHGLSVGELLLPILVTAVFSIIPLGFAFWLSSKSTKLIR